MSGLVRSLVSPPTRPLVRSLVGGVGGFDPLSLNPDLWWEENAGAVLEGVGDPAETGDAVFQCSDLSGNGNHLTQSDIAKRPTLNADGSVSGDVVDDELNAPITGLSTWTEISIFLTMPSVTAPDSLQSPLIRLNKSGSWTAFFGVADTSLLSGEVWGVLDTERGGNRYPRYMSSTLLADGDVIGWTYDGVNGNKLWLNGTEVTADKINDPPVDVLSGITSNLHFAVELHRSSDKFRNLFVKGAALTEVEIVKLSDYLKH